MPTMEGTRAFKSYKGSYDFTKDGGAVSTITLRSDDGPIPAGAVIVGGVLDVAVSCASATGTIALQVEGAADTLAATAQAGLTTGRKSIVPAFTGVTSLKTTVTRSPAMAIATAAFTAGQFDLILFYR